jgi:hypothetical protein
VSVEEVREEGGEVVWRMATSSDAGSCQFRPLLSALFNLFSFQVVMFPNL